MTPVPLSKLTADSGDSSPITNSLFLDDSNSLVADENQKHPGWPFVECMVSIEAPV